MNLSSQSLTRKKTGSETTATQITLGNKVIELPATKDKTDSLRTKANIERGMISKELLANLDLEIA